MAIDVTRSATHSIHSSTLADVLERVLDKGLVIAGDIKIKLVDIELLTIQIRLVVCSVDKALEMGMDWWTSNSAFQSKPVAGGQPGELSLLRDRLAKLRGTVRPGARSDDFTGRHCRHRADGYSVTRDDAHDNSAWTGAIAPVPRISTKSGPFSPGEWLESLPGSARGDRKRGVFLVK